MRKPRGRAAAVRLVQMRLRRVKWAVRGMRFKLWRALSDTSVHLLRASVVSVQLAMRFRETKFREVTDQMLFILKVQALSAFYKEKALVEASSEYCNCEYFAKSR